jgi:hypothetical protein
MAQAMFRYTFGIVGDAKFGVEGRGLGTGVGVMWRDCHLVLTAAHTVETTPYERLYFFLPGDTLVFRDGPIELGKLTIQKRLQLDAPEVVIDENKDIAAILVPPQRVETSQNHFFRLVETNTSPEPGTQAGYLGYPATCVQPMGANFVASPYSNFGEVTPVVETGHSATRILIRYEPADLDPHGLSGSGIWHSHSTSVVWSPQPVLSGLVTDYDEQAQALVAYKVEALIQFLMTQDWPRSG